MKLKSLYLTLLIILISQGLAFSQRYSVKAVVRDSVSDRPIEYANAVIFNKGKTDLPVTGSMTDSNGWVEIKIFRANDYQLRVSSIGYESKFVTINSQDFRDRELDLGIIQMLPVYSDMDEVVIEAKVERYEMDEEKLTMNVDDELSDIVENAFDLLSKVPGVHIDEDDNITLNGNSGILFQFNGRERKIQRSALVMMLKGMSPEMIGKIEVLNNPSAKYDSEGTSGVINIVFKSNKNYGLNGSVSGRTTYMHDFGGGGNFNLNYVDDKIISTLSIGVNQHRNKRFSSNRSYTALGVEDTILIQSTADSWNKRNGNNIYYNLDYLIDSSNSIGINLSYSKSGSPWTDNITPSLISSFPDYDLIDSSFYNFSGAENNMSNYGASVYYTHLIDTLGAKFTIDLHASINTSKNNSLRDFEYYIGDIDGVLDRYESLKQSTLTENSSYYIRADMFKPFNKSTRIEYGLKSSLSYLDNEFSSLIRTHHDSLYQNNEDRSNHFEYLENINSGYFSFSHTFQRVFTLRLGIRAEHTYARGYQEVLDSTNTNSYIHFFPNISLSRMFGFQNRLTFSYSYRISRPSYSSLNPFVEKISDYSYSKGNPLLEPQFSHSFRLAYIWKFTLFPSLSYTHTNNSVMSLDEREQGELVRITTPYNLRSRDNLHLNLNYRKDLFDRLDIFLNIGTSYSRTITEREDITDYTSLSLRGSLNASLRLPRHFRVNIFYYYSSGGQYGIYKYRSTHDASINIGKSFLDRQLNLSIGVSNIFIRQSTDSEYRYNGIITQRTSLSPRPRYSFSLRYNFGRMYERKRLERVRGEGEDSRVSGHSEPKSN